MDLKQLSSQLSVSGQIAVSDIAQIRAAGIKTIICNRPDGESADQPSSEALQQACLAQGIGWFYLPIIPGKINVHQSNQFKALMLAQEGAVLAFCRTGMRSTSLWAMSEVAEQGLDRVIGQAAGIDYDLTGLRQKLQQQVLAEQAADLAPSHDVLIIGGGAAGQAVASSLLRRKSNLDIAIVEPSAKHYYQPGWTMVGGGVFEADSTEREMAQVIPANVRWHQSSVVEFSPQQQTVSLHDGQQLHYQVLIVACGLHLDWQATPGLQEALGQYGVTSNYRFDLAPYTWQLIKQRAQQKAIFTQPAMPIKCAGAPQKAMYLACSHWREEGLLERSNVEFCTPGDVLFGVADYVPALMEYIKRYEISLQLRHNLVGVDGPNQVATFSVSDGRGAAELVEKEFTMLHVCPVQRAPDSIRNSALCDSAGWVDVDPSSLRHKQYPYIFALGDVANTGNAKTAAAVRKQAPVVAQNVISTLAGRPLQAAYNGYGSCPLTVEHGKIVLAEFCYGGQLDPSFPAWLFDGRKPTKLAWALKEKLLPWLYWNGMLKGREWLAAPELVKGGDK